MIDLIIPVYNAGDNIDRLMGSITAQTKSRGTIITFVDDGSTDNSVKLIQRWKDFSSFPIKLVQLEHTGEPGLVRQAGVDSTFADYIMFMDSDDELYPCAFEVLSRAIMSTNCDMVVSNFQAENNKGFINLTRDNFTWLHGKIYKRKFLEDNGIRFTSGMNEDSSFNHLCSLYTNSIYKIEDTTYLWRNNKNSLTRSNDDFTYEHLYTIIDSFGTMNSIYIARGGELTESYYNKALFHINLFYQYYDYYYLLKKSNAYLKGVIDHVKTFIERSKLSDFLMNMNDKYKSVIGDPAFDIVPFHYFSLAQFLEKTGYNVDLRPEKLILKEGDNENSGN